MTQVHNIVWLIVAYLIGSIPTAYLVARQAKQIDIRRHGSGNVGATNVFRVVGKGWGSAVLAIDVFKGFIVTALIANASGAFPALSTELRQIVFGAAVVSGHTWSLWLKLRGGKGVAAAGGALLGIFPLAAVLAVLVWGVSFVLSRYVSVASVIAAISFPVLLAVFYRDVQSFGVIFIISLALAAFLVFNHRANIKRLRAGEEPRVDFGKKK